MQEQDGLSAPFEANRPRLNAVAYRMLGSQSEAEDAVQEAWLRLRRVDASGVENMSGWLTTIVARICLDSLRARKSRREEPLEMHTDVLAAHHDVRTDPEHEALLAESVGLALLVVLETLTPAERVAFVLHDIFDIPFNEIAPIVERSSTAVRQLASRARRRVQGASAVEDTDRPRRREVIDAFLAASRSGNFEALLQVLAPDVAFHADSAAMRMGGPGEVHSAQSVAALFSGRAQAAKPALLDGVLGIVVAPGGRLLLVLIPTLVDGKIVRIDAVADAERLSRIAIVPHSGARSPSPSPALSSPPSAHPASSTPY